MGPRPREGFVVAGQGHANEANRDGPRLGWREQLARALDTPERRSVSSWVGITFLCHGGRAGGCKDLYLTAWAGEVQ